MVTKPTPHCDILEDPVNKFPIVPQRCNTDKEQKKKEETKKRIKTHSHKRGGRLRKSTKGRGGEKQSVSGYIMTLQDLEQRTNVYNHLDCFQRSEQAPGTCRDVSRTNRSEPNNQSSPNPKSIPKAVRTTKPTCGVLLQSWRRWRRSPQSRLQDHDQRNEMFSLQSWGHRGGHACTTFILAPVFITQTTTEGELQNRGWRRCREAKNTSSSNKSPRGDSKQTSWEEPPSLGLCAKTAATRGFSVSGTWMLPEPAGASTPRGRRPNGRRGGRTLTFRSTEALWSPARSEGRPDGLLGAKTRQQRGVLKSTDPPPPLQRGLQRGDSRFIHRDAPAGRTLSVKKKSTSQQTHLFLLSLFLKNKNETQLLYYIEFITSLWLWSVFDWFVSYLIVKTFNVIVGSLASDMK